MEFWGRLAMFCLEIMAAVTRQVFFWQNLHRCTLKKNEFESVNCALDRKKKSVVAPQYPQGTVRALRQCRDLNPLSLQPPMPFQPACPFLMLPLPPVDFPPAHTQVAVPSSCAKPDSHETPISVWWSPSLIP